MKFFGNMALLLSLGSLGLACQPEPQRPRIVAAENSAEPDLAAPAVASAPTPVASAQEPTPTAAQTPTAVQVPLGPSAVPSAEGPQSQLQVLVSDLPAVDPGKRLLVGYERLGKPRNAERIEVNTDHNAVEFPSSVTSAKIRSVAAPDDLGSGSTRAMKLQLRLQDQQTDFAGCIGKVGKDGCGCEDLIPYAYISLSHGLPTGVHLHEFNALSFWVKSADPFELHIVLSCHIEPRPKTSGGANRGYLDAAHTQIDPCWQSPRVELPLSSPIAILGDNAWHRYQVTIAELKASAPVKLQGGGTMVCSLDKVTHVAYVLKKSHPPEPGEYPKDAGVVYFDDLDGVTVP